MGNKTQAMKRLCVSLAWTAALNAQATVYRCGTIYQDTPCAGGKTIQAEDARSTQQQAETARATQKDAALADALQKQRLQQEAQWAKQERAAIELRQTQAAQAAKEAKEQAARVAKADVARQKALQPHKIKTRKTPPTKAGAAQGTPSCVQTKSTC